MTKQEGVLHVNTASVGSMACGGVESEDAQCQSVHCPCEILTASREREVFHFLLRGRTEKEVAAHLGISHHTVHDYCKRVYRRFGVTSHLDLMARVLSLVFREVRE